MAGRLDNKFTNHIANYRMREREIKTDSSEKQDRTFNVSRRYTVHKNRLCTQLGQKGGGEMNGLYGQIYCQ